MNTNIMRRLISACTAILIMVVTGCRPHRSDSPSQQGVSSADHSEITRAPSQPTSLIGVSPALTLDIDNCGTSDSLAQQSDSTAQTRRAFVIGLSTYINDKVLQGRAGKALVFNLQGSHNEILQIVARPDQKDELLAIAQDDSDLKKRAQYCALGFAQIRFLQGDQAVDVINIDLHDAQEFLTKSPNLIAQTQSINAHELSLQKEADRLNSLTCYSPEILRTLPHATLDDRVAYVNSLNASHDESADKIYFVDGGNDGEVLTIFAPSYIAPTLLDKITRDPETMTSTCLRGFARLEMWTGASTGDGKLIGKVDTDPMSASNYLSNSSSDN